MTLNPGRLFTKPKMKRTLSPTMKKPSIASGAPSSIFANIKFRGSWTYILRRSSAESVSICEICENGPKSSSAEISRVSAPPIPVMPPKPDDSAELFVRSQRRIRRQHRLHQLTDRSQQTECFQIINVYGMSFSVFANAREGLVLKLRQLEDEVVRMESQTMRSRTQPSTLSRATRSCFSVSRSRIVTA